MCGRYVVFTEEENEEMLEILKGINQRYKNEASLMKTGEIFPTDTAPVITGSSSRSDSSYNSDSSGIAKDLQLFKWGFPHYMKAGSLIINARCETLQEKPTFRKLLAAGRCLIPASGFYEWKAAAGTTRQKDKYLIRSASSGLIYFAGLYGSFADKSDMPSTRFVIITTDANGQMSEIHHRMPVILEKDQALAWIGHTRSGSSLDGLLKPYEKELTFQKVV
ncbi:putative SOS response-associated peptidase YedK [Ruminiclostridium hungatei]|uniref:Abasic site processing protein n=1 Tax=Ruminiclostridium hungatei TaxID=48256 RepID=A0A1V4SHS1_RUMHU|nr:SOS response-associated peptidase [Ruminiclostridium hungatei]OPX43303.1 putative SOS response-associated peptidase YedK [Ruminiclostridium hungatei]